MRALVLSGGGSKGAYQEGVLKRWLCEEGREYDILCGISVGALNTSVLCQAPKGQPQLAYMLLNRLWDRVENRKVRKNWFLGYLALIWKPSVYNTKPLETWVHSELDVNLVRESGRQLRVGAVSWDSGEYRVVDQDDPELHKWVLASASFPTFFKPVKIAGEEWADGGLRNVTPLGEAIRAGATEIDVILTNNPDLVEPWHPEKKFLWWTMRRRSFVWRVLRAIELLSNEVVLGDLKECGLKNDIAKLGGPYKDVKIRVVYPSQLLTKDSLDFDPASISRMRKIGYEDALKI